MGERPEPKIVGSGSAERKEAITLKITKSFGESHYEQFSEEQRAELKAGEYDKRPEEVAAIRVANDITDRLMEKFGVHPFDVPERNIHIVPGEIIEKLFGGSASNVATTYYDKEGVAMSAAAVRQNPIYFAEVILHEIAHLKAPLAFSVEENSVSAYRTGVHAGTTTAKKMKIGSMQMFGGLEEAIVAEIGKRYFEEAINSNQFLKEEADWQRSEEALNFKGWVAWKEGIPIEDIVSVSREGKEQGRLPHPELRRTLNYLADCIAEDNPEISKDEVMKTFFGAHFTGRLLPIAKNIEASFGKGSFRVLSMMEIDPNSVNKMQDYLMKQRRLALAKRKK